MARRGEDGRDRATPVVFYLSPCARDREAEERRLRSPATAGHSGGRGGDQWLALDVGNPFQGLGGWGNQRREREEEGDGSGISRWRGSPAARQLNRGRLHLQGVQVLTLAVEVGVGEPRGELATGSWFGRRRSCGDGAPRATTCPNKPTIAISTPRRSSGRMQSKDGGGEKKIRLRSLPAQGRGAAALRATGLRSDAPGGGWECWERKEGSGEAQEAKEREGDEGGVLYPSGGRGSFGEKAMGELLGSTGRQEQSRAFKPAQWKGRDDARRCAEEWRRDGGS